LKKAAAIDETTGRDRRNNWLRSTKQLAAIDEKLAAIDCLATSV
jgi:hypothetical protein